MSIETKYQQQQVVTTETRHRITLRGADIVQMLRDRGNHVPDGAVVDVTVPGGGDWSGMALNLDDEDTPIEITWRTTTTETAGR